MTKYCKILLLISALLFLLLFFSAALSTNEQQKQITVVLRFDDTSSKSCTEIEEKLIADFRKLNMRCTFGVIPFISARDCHDPAPQELIPLPMAKIEMLRQASEDGVVEIAQHGYSHQTNDLRVDKDHNYSEFVGFSYEKQLERIKQGKEFLEQKLKMPVTTFIPPWNSYDPNTAKALEQLEFQSLSADIFGFASPSSSLKFLPCTCSFLKVKNAIEAARNTPDPAPIVIVLLHEYDFIETNNQKGIITYDDFLHTITWLSSQEDVSIGSVDQLNHLDSNCYIANYTMLRLSKLLPTWLTKHSPLVFLSAEGIGNAKPKYYMLVFAFYASILFACCAISILFGTIFLPKMHILSKLFLFLGPILLLIGSIYTFHDLKFGLKGLVSVVITLSYCIGTWCSNLGHKCKVSQSKIFNGIER